MSDEDMMRARGAHEQVKALSASEIIDASRDGGDILKICNTKMPAIRHFLIISMHAVDLLP